MRLNYPTDIVALMHQPQLPVFEVPQLPMEIVAKQAHVIETTRTAQEQSEYAITAIAIKLLYPDLAENFADSLLWTQGTWHVLKKRIESELPPTPEIAEFLMMRLLFPDNHIFALNPEVEAAFARQLPKEFNYSAEIYNVKCCPFVIKMFDPSGEQLKDLTAKRLGTLSTILKRSLNSELDVLRNELENLLGIQLALPQFIAELDKDGYVTNRLIAYFHEFAEHQIWHKCVAVSLLLSLMHNSGSGLNSEGILILGDVDVIEDNPNLIIDRIF